MADLNRLNLYLQQDLPATYVNTEHEQMLVQKFAALFHMSKQAKEANELANSANILKWRKAYYGTLSALDMSTGKESVKRSKQLRKLIFEMVESKIDNNVPLPRLIPKYKGDLPVIDITEEYLKYEIGNIFTKYVNDRSERATYVDGTSWYKVWWDNCDNSHTRSGNVKIDVCLADQIIPQPGVIDYRQMEYIFELQNISVSKIYDLYGRIIPASSPTEEVAVVVCYYLNSERVVGRFAWAQHSNTVIYDEKDWQIRKIRHCSKCNEIVAIAKECPVCGSKSFKYKNATEEILDEDLQILYNPYDVGETDDEEEREKKKVKTFATAGTKIPFYIVRQLPFVPRPAISSIESIYGIGEPFILIDMQDSINKILTKAEDKTLKSGAVVTKPQKVRMSDDDATIKLVEVKAAEQAQMIQVRQIVADTQQDIILANIEYDSAKSSSGVTDSFQGKKDTTATSGKAKEFAAVQTAGRIESLRVMKAASFAGLYDLVLKYLLAFSDEDRKFVRKLPDGSVIEPVWNKYLFLDKDKHGTIYYRDDLSFSSDPAATLSQDRVAMWQETQDKLINGALGDPADPRTLTLYWNMMDQQQYPLAKLALAGIKDNSQHLPPELEKLLVENPELLQMVIQMAQEQGMLGGEQRGGARQGSGPKPSGVTRGASVERTNERNRAANRDAGPIPLKGGDGGI